MFLSKRILSVRLKNKRLESTYPLGVSAIALVQVRNVECLIEGRRSKEDRIKTKPQTDKQIPNISERVLGRTFGICVHSEVEVYVEGRVEGGCFSL